MFKLSKKEIEHNAKTKAFAEYERGKNFLAGNLDFFNKTDMAHRFYDGEQWSGIKAPKGVTLPVLNVIKAILLYKISIVSQQGMTVNFSANNYGDPYLHKKATDICSKINNDYAKYWENNNMDAMLWEVFSDGAKTGEKYAYSIPKIHRERTGVFIEGEEKVDETLENIEVRQIDGTNIMLGDENTPDIQKQPYIILPYRDIVKNVRAEAKANGLSKEDIAEIVADNSDLEYQAGDSSRHEVNDGNENGKVLCLIRFEKKDGEVWFSKSTANVEFCPPKNTKCKLYPIAAFLWANIKGSARGLGEVVPLIPNQIEINKNLFRLSKALKTSATSKIIFDKFALPNLKTSWENSDLIGLSNYNAQAIKEMITFLEPPPMRMDAKVYMQDLITLTRELAGAGDIAVGNINPEKASGAAIVAVRDASAVPLNGQMSRAKKFVEDLARIWIDLKIAYSPNGIEVITTHEEPVLDERGVKTGETETVEVMEVLGTKDVEELKLSIKIDVSPANPFSLYKEEQEILNLWSNGKLDDLKNSEVLELLPNKSALAEKVKQAEEKKETPPQLPPIIPNNDIPAGVGGVGSPPPISPPQPATAQVNSLPPELLMALAQQGGPPI